MRGVIAVRGFVCAALALTGCFEADVEVRLVSDGGGTVRVVLLLPAEAVPAPRPGDGERRMADAAAAHLLAWRGVEAWSELDLVVVEGEDRARLLATGWAADLTRVRAPLDPSPALAFEREGARAKVRVAPLSAGWSDMDGGTWTAERRRLLEQAGALGESRLRLRLHLPGPAEGAAGSTVERTWDGPRLRQSLTDLVGALEVLRGRVAAGEVPAGEVTARETALLARHLGLEAASELPADDRGAGELFRQGLAAAREAWERRGAPSAAKPAQPLDPAMREAQRELELARADEERARAEMERWERELEQMNEEEEDSLRAEAAEDPMHARLLVELAPSPPGLQAQVLVAQVAPAQPAPNAPEAPKAIGTVLEQGRCDLPGLEPGPWKVTVLVFDPEGSEWSWSREARLVGGGLSRIDFAWPADGGSFSGKVEPAPGRVARAWSGDLRVTAPVDTTGAFRLGPLPPGKWKVAVTDGAGPWVDDPAQLPAGLEVELAPGKSATIAPPGVAWEGNESRVLWR